MATSNAANKRKAVIEAQKELQRLHADRDKWLERINSGNYFGETLKDFQKHVKALDDRIVDQSDIAHRLQRWTPPTDGSAPDPLDAVLSERQQEREGPQVNTTGDQDVHRQGTGTATAGTATVKPAATPLAGTGGARQPAPAGPATGTAAGAGTPAASSAPAAPVAPVGPKSYTILGSGDTELMSAFGWSSALADVPELKSIMDKAAAAAKAGTPWTQETMDAEVQKNYTSKNGSPQMAWVIKQHLHPVDAAKALDDKAQELQDQATGVGFTLSHDKAKKIAETVLSHGLNAAAQQRAVLGEFHFDPTQARGSTASSLDQLKALAKSYMVPVSDNALGQWVESIAKNTDTEDSFTEYLRNQAKGMFPSFGALIDAGHTPRTLLDPYASMIEQELGIPSGQVDLADPKYMGQLMQTDPKQGTRVLPTLDQWQTTLRTDPRYGWDKTVGAQNQAAQLAQQLAKGLGAAA